MKTSVVSERKEKTVSQKDIKIIAKGAGINFFGEIAGSVITFVFHFVLARCLPVEFVGLFFLGMSINRFTMVILTCGFSYGMVRYVSVFYQENDSARIKGTIISGLAMVIPLSIVGTVVLYFIADKLAITFFHRPEVSSVTKIMLFAIPFTAVSEILLSSIQAMKIMKYKVYVKRLIIPILEVIVFFILLGLGFQSTSAIIAYTVSFIIGSLFAFYYFRKLFVVFSKKVTAIYNFKELTKFSVTRLFSQVLIFFIMWTDTFMIAHYMAPKDVGVYNIVGRLILFGALISYSFANIFAPIISPLCRAKAWDDLRKQFTIVTKLAFTLNFPYYLLLISLPSYALHIFGEEYVAGSSCLIVLSLARIFDTLTGPTSEMINMIGKPALNLCNDLGTFVFNIILNVFLIPRYGIYGAAIATACSLTIINLLRIIEVYYILGMHPYNFSYLKLFLSGLILIGSLVSSQYFIFPYCNIPLIAVITLLCLGLYFLSIKFFGLEEEDYVILSLIKKKLSYGVAER